ncbi:STAS/SEC14 domain-containing protein [Aurantiacibacter sp. D1-12]|uniref:STAS/SEC14 domain-containing protein n=1 Tax=Aurantiacibacter sp. D1-12 TaxID=2993658 RepID=UPI00237CA5E0|nr:STAS/SEC14 domain-containing protein [Aurantiacibacter sp. D1-12]MDE1468497.1 STAS/SEC14 domain-containing protein [Aurantiacibacter sp. D1-12]
MTNAQNRYAIALNEANREVHFSIEGLWSTEEMQQFLRELTDAARPFMHWNEAFAVIADMDEFVPQDRQTTETIARHLQCARGFGFQRLAIVTHSSILRMQYRRIAGDLELDFFATKLEALQWSRNRGAAHRNHAA